MSSPEPLLTVRSLCAGYGGGRTVADVSFTLSPGEILCLVGESGCGKSTLLKALMGTTPGLEVISGEILLDATNLLSLPFRERQRLCCEKMGLIFQSPGAAFNPIRSYRKQFVETLKSHGKYRKDVFFSQVETAFSKLGLTDSRRILESCPYEMSGGMNQRIALALTLLLEQDILLADEPTSALDATIQRQVALELRRLRDMSGMAQIIVTHNLALAQFLADRIGVMYAGRLVELGTPEQVLMAPGHAYTRSLLAAIPSLQGGMPLGLPGQPPLDGPSERGCEFYARCPHRTGRCENRAYALRDMGDGHLAGCVLAEGGAP